MNTTPTNTANIGQRSLRSSTRTPNPRNSNDDQPLSSARRPVHTPLNRAPSRDLATSTRRGGTSASGGRRDNNAPTPHAKAARRALDQRRNALFTPGKNRRRSLLEQRKTPSLLLRDLARKLAPGSQPVASSSSPRDAPTEKIATIDEGNESDESDPPLVRPRLSLPLDEDFDDSDLVPPQLSQLENETLHTVELPRRAVPDPRLSRGSFASAAFSDLPQSDDGNDNMLGDQSDLFPSGFAADIQARAQLDGVPYERVDVDSPRRATPGQESDFNFEIPAGMDDRTTFLFSEPVDASTTSPLMGRSAIDVTGQQDASENVSFPAFDNVDVADLDDDGDIPGLGDDPPDFDAAEDSPGREVEQGELDAPRQRQAQLLRKKRKRMSKHGIEYPPLPSSFVKRVSQTALQSSGLGNTKVSADTLTALSQASDWFFEQLGEDLGAYATHAKRKTIEESDVLTLMRRQRRVNADATMFSLAQKHLPRELLQELRMPVPQPAKSRSMKRSRMADQEEEAADIT